jgi:hypothetical protein
LRIFKALADVFHECGMHGEEIKTVQEDRQTEEP